MSETYKNQLSEEELENINGGTWNLYQKVANGFLGVGTNGTTGTVFISFADYESSAVHIG